MSESARRYSSYLLRIWQADGNGKTVWRASLESARTGTCRGFHDLESLFEFLREEASASFSKTGQESQVDKRKGGDGTL